MSLRPWQGVPLPASERSVHAECDAQRTFLLQRDEGGKATITAGCATIPPMSPERALARADSVLPLPRPHRTRGATAVRIFATLILLSLATALHAQDPARYIPRQTPGLVETYKDLHAPPELSHHEERTSTILAKGLREAGYTVAEHVGVYPDGSHAFGVVGILKDGPGQTLL